MQMQLKQDQKKARVSASCRPNNNRAPNLVLLGSVLAHTDLSAYPQSVAEGGARSGTP